jgi:hypothetical protein
MSAGLHTSRHSFSSTLPMAIGMSFSTLTFSSFTTVESASR